jgi:hypothetical protein
MPSPQTATLIRKARLFLAGFLPVGVFAIVLLLAIGAWGLWWGIVGGAVLGGGIAWLLVRLIAASPAAQWVASAVVAAVAALYALSFW